MELNQLRYFVSAALFLSFTKAAEDRYTSQSNVSHQISNLEEELGVKLFERLRNQVKLTPSGEAFLARAQEILAAAELAKHEARQAGDGTVGRLRIGFIDPATQPILSQLLFKFHEIYPYVHVDLTEGHWDFLNVGLKNDSFDICFSMDMPERNASDLEVMHLCEYPVSLITRVEDPAVRGGRIDYALLEGRSFIYLQDHSCEEDIIKLGKKRGFLPRIEYRTMSLMSLFSLVSAGCGIAIMPDFAKRANYDDSLLFTPFQGDDARVMVSALWRSTSRNPSLDLFKQELGHFIAQHDVWTGKIS